MLHKYILVLLISRLSMNAFADIKRIRLYSSCSEASGGGCSQCTVVCLNFIGCGVCQWCPKSSSCLLAANIYHANSSDSYSSNKTNADHAIAGDCFIECPKEKNKRNISSYFGSGMAHSLYLRHSESSIKKKT